MLKLRACALALVLLSTTAYAADAPQTVGGVEQAYASLDYAGAKEGADGLLSRGHLSHDDTLRAARVRALAAAALEQTEEAKNAFIYLLTLDPAFTVDPRLGPRFREPFNEARGYWSGQASKAGIEAQVSVHGTGTSSARVITRDPTNIVSSVVFSYRWAPAKVYRNVAVKAGDSQLDIPEAPKGATRLDFFVYAQDKSGNLVLEKGSEGAPQYAAVPVVQQSKIANEKRSIFASPWFWAAAVLVVAGGTTAGIVAATTGGTDAPPPRVQWSPSLRCGTGACE